MSQKAIFLDRDDTLIDDPGYIEAPDQVELLPGAAEALIQLKRMGYLVIIITNQSAIARGMITEARLEQIHQRLKSLLTASGATFDGIYYCPYHPDGTVEAFAKESSLRKPQPGMLLKAAEDMDIDLSQSWMIGDRDRDIEAGKAAGCHTILVDVPGKPRTYDPDSPKPDRKAVNLREAVNIIRMYEFHQKAQAARQAADPGDSPSSGSFFPEAPIKESPAAPPVKPDPQPAPAAVPPRPPLKADKPAAPEPQPKAAPEPARPAAASMKFHTARTVPRPETAPAPAEAEDKEHLLQELMQRLDASRLREFSDDFSIHKLLAGMAQVLALGCIVFSLFLLLSPNAGTESVLVMIGYGIALQLLVISLLMMHRRD